MRGEAIQEIDLLADNAEDVDADLQREPLCLKHKLNPVFALSGTSVSVANGEGPSVPMTCQATGVSVPLHEPAKDIAAQILQISPKEVPVTRPPKPTRDVAAQILRTHVNDVSTPILQTSAINVPAPRPPSPTRGVSDQTFQPSSRDALLPRNSISAIDIPAPRNPSPTREVSMPILQTSARGV